jgi:putative endonuclease
MGYHVYILASRSRTLYTGVAFDLRQRLSQHASGHGSKFVQKYNINRLVFAEEAATRMEAVSREKQIKRWRREKKITLIESVNLHWVDMTNTVQY